MKTRPDQTPPHSVETEQSILAACLTWPEALEEAFELLSPADFYRTGHQIIFQACLDLHHKNQPADLVTVGERLVADKKAESIGGISYLAKIIDGCPIATNMAAYAAIVREKALLRSMMNAAYKVIADCQNSNGNAPEVLAEAQKSMLCIDLGMNGDQFKSMKDLTTSAVDRYEETAKHGSSVTGILSGFADLDKTTAGFQSKDLIVIGGRPSMGKTAFALSMIINQAKAGHPVAFFSLEMGDTAIFDRIMSSEARVNSMRIRSGRFSQDDWQRIHRTAERLYDAPIFIDDTPSLHYSEIARRARRLKRKEGIEAIFIDYLGLAQGDRQNGRVEEVSSISRGFKAMAKELQVPVIAMHQLNRSCEMRKKDDRRPQLSDLRDSGAIEQDADVVLFLYRDEVYFPDTPKKGVAEAIIAKQRSGPTGTIYLTWTDSITRFDSAAIQ